MTESTTPPVDVATDKRRKVLITSAAIGGLLLAVGGSVIYLKSASTDAKPTDRSINDVNLAGNGDQASIDGQAQLTPDTVMMQQQMDKSYLVTAQLNTSTRDAVIASIEAKGGQGFSIKSNCPEPGQILKAHTTCRIDVVFRPDQASAVVPQMRPAATPPAAGLTTAVPAAAPTTAAVPDMSGYTLAAMVSIKDPKAGATGRQQTLTAKLAGLPATAQGNAVAGQGGIAMGNAGAGQPVAGYGQPAGPLGPNGSYAQSGGPVQSGPQNSYGAPAGGYPQGGAPYGGGAGTGGYGGAQYDQNGNKVLTPKERYILARRESAFSGASHGFNGVVNAQATGSWGDIKVPSVTSSKPQDMSRVVTMDRVITAVLVRNFDSRASQQVVAQVDRNVYGAAGRNILIPRGSTVIGTMASGSERSVVNWTQIIRPDGARFMMKASGGDAMGQAGVPGYTDHRYWKRFGSILMGTVLKSGVAIGTNAASTATTVPGGQVTSSQNNGAIVSGIVSNDINSIVQQIIAENSAVKPVTTVPAGTRLTIFPQQDLMLFPIDQQIIVTPDYPRHMNAGAQQSKYDAGDNRGAEQAPRQAPPPVAPGSAPAAATAAQRQAPKAPFSPNLDPKNTGVSDKAPW